MHNGSYVEPFRRHRMNQPPSPVSRRTALVGAGTVGALAAAASLLPGVREATPATAALPKAPPNGGGYSLSDHVRQYYQTARI
jgi:hypothetical protein